MRIYLDNCCYNRPFDDQKQLRIRLEAAAKLGVQQVILEKKVELAWSYVLDFENELNPFEQRKVLVRRWKTHATVDTDETAEIIEQAEALVQLGLKGKDALHLACAIALKCDYFLTSDDHLIKKSIGIVEIKVTDPMTFVREELE
jgi:predicted nucleic acid-binding protein